MRSSVILGGPKTVRYRGRRPPVTFPGVPILIAAAVLALSWIAGWQLGARFVIFGGLSVLSVTVLYLLSIVRNYITLDEADLRIATWLANPFKDIVIPYSAILEMEADDATGALAFQFANQTGEREHAGILLDEVAPSSVRDEIRSRQSGDVQPKVQPDIRPPVIDQQDLPTQKNIIKFQVWRMPSWPWYLAAAAPVVAVLVLIANGFELTPLRIFGTTIFFEALVLGIFFLFALPKRFELQAEKLVMTGFQEFHRIPYEDITTVTPYETGQLVVEYTKREKFGFGGGEETASTRLLKHSESAIAAAYIRAAVERAKHRAA